MGESKKFYYKEKTNIAPTQQKVHKRVVDKVQTQGTMGGGQKQSCCQETFIQGLNRLFTKEVNWSLK